MNKCAFASRHPRRDPGPARAQGTEWRERSGRGGAAGGPAGRQGRGAGRAAAARNLAEHREAARSGRRHKEPTALGLDAAPAKRASTSPFLVPEGKGGRVATLTGAPPVTMRAAAQGLAAVRSVAAQSHERRRPRAPGPEAAPRGLRVRASRASSGDSAPGPLSAE